MEEGTVFPDLTRLFSPRSVVLVGASGREGTIGRIAFDNIVQHSAFEGELYLVNATRPSIDGHKAYPNVSALPGSGFDVALIVVPAPQVIEVLEACAEKRIRFAIVITSGFAELGPAGAAAEQRMRTLAASSGMRIYGPNCPGVTNINRRIGLNISPSFKTDTQSGPIGLVTQGGGLGRAVVQAADRGTGVGLWGSPGNEVDLQVADLVHHMVEDPTVRVIAAIVEGFKSGERFVAAAEAAARARKPLVLLKMGRSAYGVAAAQSHTAAIAGEDAINDAVLRQFGVIRVDDLVELHETASLLARASAPPRSICITSLSGGAATYAADILGAEGLSLVQLSSDTRRRLTAIVPDFISVGNPLDLTTAIFSDRELHRSALGVLLQDQQIDAIVMPIPADYGEHTHRVAEDLLAAQTTTQKLLLPVWISERHGSGYAALEKGGLPPFRSMTAAARALRRLADYGSWLQRRGTVEPKSRPPVPVHIAVPDWLDEVSAKSWLASYGVSLPPEQLATTPSEAAAFAERIGRPVALKIVSPDVAHKSDVGGVELGLTGPATVAAAYSRIIERVRIAHPQAQISGVLVSELLTDGIEMLLGFHHDSTFGPVLTIGFGGIFVEVLRDVVHLRLPTSRDEIRVAIDRLRGRRLLDGIRGRPPADFDALLDAAESFAVFGFAQRGLVVEAEINPLIVRPAGLGAFAADALIRTRRSEISPAVQG